MTTKKEGGKFENKDPRFARRIAMLGKNITFDGPPKTWTAERSIEASRESCELFNKSSGQNYEEI